MKKTIQKFIDDKKLAIVGASNNKDNFGTFLLKELKKLGYEPVPVNPGCEEIEGIACVPTVKELPPEIENVILAVPADLTGKIAEEAIGTPVKRVWMIRGFGKGAYSEETHELCRNNNIEVVHGFCPMMFFSKGAHKFHFWLRKRFGKMPAEYLVTDN